MIRDASEGRIYFNKHTGGSQRRLYPGTNPAKAQLPGTPGDGATGWFDEEQTKEMHKEDEKRNKNKNKILQDQEWLCEIT